MARLPDGTVTFLFSDIEGSTRLLLSKGDEYAELLADQRRLLRSAFAEHHGVEVDTQGDAFFIAFAKATDAAAAGLAAQAALASSELRVQIGLHTGEPTVTDEGYVGIDVHRAARIMSAGHGGQIIASARTTSFLGGIECLDLGLHRLKDLGDAERLYQVGGGSFPPPRTLDATNLPISASALVGRRREVEELLGMLSGSSRLVTLVGPGGTGKTRLAIEVASELVGKVRDGVFSVPLAGVADPELALPEVAQALGARHDLLGFVRERELVILVDNVEHLLGVGPALTQLLAGSRGLRLLVTSRAPLRVSGEHMYAVEPLETPAGVDLLRQRALAVGRELEAGETADAIVQKLDGLPLVIELAAARARLLSPEGLLRRLDEALPLLTSGVRDAPERQRTLRAAIGWSYDLLDDEAKALFASLSVFAGGFSIDAAEVVCDADLDRLSALVDLSLVKAAGGDRFLLLDTIRAYAAEQLVDRELARDRHAVFYTSLAEEAYRGRGQAEAEWAARLEADHDNLRAALDHSPGSLELAGWLGWFWLTHSHLTEGAARLAQALVHGAGAEPARARALVAAGAIAGQRGRAEEAEALFADGIATWNAVGDQAELATALDTFGWFLFFAGENERGVRSFERSLELARELGDVAFRDSLPRRLRADRRELHRGRAAVPRQPAGGAAAGRRPRDELRGAGSGDGRRRSR